MSGRITYTNETGQNFFTQRRNQLENAQSEHFPDVMALFSELIQNSDDAKSSELSLGFTEEGLYISSPDFFIVNIVFRAFIFFYFSFYINLV